MPSSSPDRVGERVGVGVTAAWNDHREDTRSIRAGLQGVGNGARHDDQLAGANLSGRIVNFEFGLTAKHDGDLLLRVRVAREAGTRCE